MPWPTRSPGSEVYSGRIGLFFHRDRSMARPLGVRNIDPLFRALFRSSAEGPFRAAGNDEKRDDDTLLPRVPLYHSMTRATLAFREASEKDVHEV
jgi:hypothetical protein